MALVWLSVHGGWFASYTVWGVVVDVVFGHTRPLPGAVQSTQNPWYARVLYLVEQLHRLQRSLHLALKDAKNAPRSSRSFFVSQASKTRAAVKKTKAQLAHAKQNYLEDQATVPEVRSKGLGSYATDAPLALAEEMERRRKLARDRRAADAKVGVLQRALEVVNQARPASKGQQQTLSDALHSAQQDQRKLRDVGS